MHYVLFYELDENYLSRRGQFREEHLQKAWREKDLGHLILAGALANPTDQAILLFHGDSPQCAEDFAKNDPYVQNGLVKRWCVRQWATVVGDLAATPVRPSGIAAEISTPHD